MQLNQVGVGDQLNVNFTIIIIISSSNLFSLLVVYNSEMCVM